MDRLLAQGCKWKRGAGLVALALAAAGCPETTPKIIGGDALLSDVAQDQAFAAVLAKPTRLANGGHTGTLQVVPVPGGGGPTVLDSRSNGGVYRHGSNLWFLAGVTIVDEGTPATPHVYGALKLWSFPMEQAVHLGDNVRELSPSWDGSTCVFIDWAQKSIDPANTGTLKAVTAASCATGTCAEGVPIVLASNIVAGQASWALSNDGRQLLVAVAGSDATAPGQAILLGLESGQAQVLSTAAGIRSAMISPAGDTAAWVQGDNTLMAVTTAEAMPTPRAIAVSAARIESAQMVDAANYVVVARANAGDAPALMKVGTSGTVPLGVTDPVDLFVSQAVPGVTTKYALYSTAVAAAGGTEDLFILDLSKSSAPVQIGEAVALPLASSVEFSDDGAWLRYLDGVDLATGLGNGYVSPTATPARNLVANGIRQLAFVPHTSELLYVAPSASSDAGFLTRLPALDQPPDNEGVGVVNFVVPRSAPFRTYYSQQSGTQDDGVWYLPRP
jgi:hypothetical protein